MKVYKKFKIEHVEYQKEDLYYLYGEPYGWFKKWELIEVNKCLHRLELKMKDHIKYPKVISRREYNHQGQQEYDCW